ncbi:Elongin-A [Rhizina undulata]
MPGFGPVKSLQALCKLTLIKHVDLINDVGDLEYDFVRPILIRLTSTVQLKRLELNSPQIAGPDAEIWKRLIARDFGNDAIPKYTPENPKSWSKVYDRHQADTELLDNAATEELKLALNSLSSAKAQQKTRVVASTAGLPGQRRSGTGSSGWGRSAQNWNVKAGSRTKNIIEKAKREAKELAYFRSSNLSRPTRALTKKTEIGNDLKRKITETVVEPKREPPKPVKRVKEDEKKDEEEGDGEGVTWKTDGVNVDWVSGVRLAKIPKLKVPAKQKAPVDVFMRKKPAVPKKPAPSGGVGVSGKAGGGVGLLRK